jgi:hypothetical protein
MILLAAEAKQAASEMGSMDMRIGTQESRTKGVCTYRDHPEQQQIRKKQPKALELQHTLCYDSVLA